LGLTAPVRDDSTTDFAMAARFRMTAPQDDIDTYPFAQSGLGKLTYQTLHSSPKGHAVACCTQQLPYNGPGSIAEAARQLPALRAVAGRLLAALLARWPAPSRLPR
jgi:hypothetical protein